MKNTRIRIPQVSPLDGDIQSPKFELTGLCPRPPFSVSGMRAQPTKSQELGFPYLKLTNMKPGSQSWRESQNAHLREDFSLSTHFVGCKMALH